MRRAHLLITKTNSAGKLWNACATCALCLVAGILLAGCAAPAPDWRFDSDGGTQTFQQVMARQDKIIHLSFSPASTGKPILLALHGATDDPTEMMSIVRQWRDDYDVFLYSYNYHQRIETVAVDFLVELRNLRRNNPHGGPMTVLVYSYSAIVFRSAVVSADDPNLFAGASLIQLVPTAGGSHLARTMEFPISAWLTALASKPSYAENPYGRLARQIWAGDGNKKFYEAILPRRVHTLILEGDSHSLAGVKNQDIQERYKNGLGPNVTVIPAAPGLTHDYFPTNPVALQYLSTILELPEGSHHTLQVAAHDSVGLAPSL